MAAQLEVVRSAVICYSVCASFTRVTSQPSLLFQLFILDREMSEREIAHAILGSDCKAHCLTHKSAEGAALYKDLARKVRKRAKCPRRNEYCNCVKHLHTIKSLL